MKLNKISLVIIIAVLANIFLSLLLAKKIDLLGWIIRGLFLFVGFAGFFCQASFEDIKKTSLVIRLFGKQKKA